MGGSERKRYKVMVDNKRSELKKPGKTANA